MDEYGNTRRDLPGCEHKPPRSTAGPLGMTESCRCGAVTYVLRYSGNDGSGRSRIRWDRWE